MIHSNNLNGARAFKKHENSSPLEDTNTTNSSPSFECNICLDNVRDPVVTFCGHLYCWPCIYKWITTSRDPRCPTCKKGISEDALIPLYGRGQTNAASATNHLIPQRPTNPRCTNDTNPSRVSHYNTPRYDDSYPAAFGFGESTRYCLFDPMIGMLGEMVCWRMFGGSDDRPSLYAYRGSYGSLGDRASPRRARRVAESDRSLGRVFLFLCSCVLVCLILF